MDHQQLEDLLEKYITGDLSAAERRLLAAAIELPDGGDVLEAFARRVMATENTELTGDPAIRTAILSDLEARMREHRGERSQSVIRQKKKTLFMVGWVRYAAAVLLIVITGAAFWAWQRGKKASVPVAQAQPQDVPPGKTGAILTLADGRQVVLDSIGNAALPVQGSMAVARSGNGRLEYTTAGAAAAGTASAEVVFNTLTTPRGRSMSVVLADGTRVWLNAASTLRYPVPFVGGKRVVQVSGEAYFEVAKNPAMPFTVEVDRPGRSKQEIRVLGTAFDVSAYTDDSATCTTLVEGAVNVADGAVVKQLQPGEQLIATGDQMRLEQHGDVQKAIAWKEGSFVFNNDDIAGIMKQLARWYDIDVHFEGVVADHYSGKISRQVNISKVLYMLEMVGGVTFSVQNNRITVAAKAM